MSIRSALALLTCLTLCACPGTDKDGDSSTGGTTDASATEPTGGDVNPACACIDPEMFGAASYTCPAPLCGVVSLKCDTEAGGSDPLCGTGTVVDFDEAALDCALDQLIAGTPGRVEWHALSEGSGSSAFDGAFLSIADGLTRSYGGFDANSQESAAGFVTLKDAAYFKGCKAETEVAARYNCFRAWSDGEPAAECDAADELSEQF